MIAPEFELSPEDRAWSTQGRCVDGAATMTRLFFSDELHDIARAKAVCAKCPVATECLSAALRNQEPWGVWGGQLVVNGRIVTNKRARGRPPKNPLPVVAVEEGPIPPHLIRSA